MNFLRWSNVMLTDRDGRVPKQVSHLGALILPGMESRSGPYCCMLTRMAIATRVWMSSWKMSLSTQTSQDTRSVS